MLRNHFPLAAAALLAASVVSAHAADLKGSYESKSGKIVPPPDEAANVEIVTTDTVPGKNCESVGAQFPAMALPKALANIQAMKNIADAAVRATLTIREAAVAAGANAVVGFRTSTFVGGNGGPRLLAYGTLAHCE